MRNPILGRASYRALPGPRVAACLVVLAGLVAAANATAQLGAVEISSDVTWVADAEAIGPRQVARLTLPASISTVNLGPAIPPSANVTALMRVEDGTPVFALDTFADLDGVFAGPEDLIAWNGAAYSLFLDGSATGVPRGAAIDAAGRAFVEGDYITLVSFDVTVLLPGGLTVDDEDVAAWDGAEWSLHFDGTANDVPAALDLDGYDLVSEQQYLSFDGSGNIAAAAFDDEDIVAFSSGMWTLAVDGSATLGFPFAAGDLDALTIPADDIFQDGFESAAAVAWLLRGPASPANTNLAMPEFTPRSFGR